MKKLSFLTMAISMICPLSAYSVDFIPMVVGTYTGTGSEGIYSFRFDQDNGAYFMLDSMQAVNPSYLIFNSDGSKIYSVNELDDSGAGVCAIDFDKKTGELLLINGVPSSSGAPCYISSNGKIVVTANYGGGTMTVFPLNTDGSVLPVSGTYSGEIGGPDLTRQEAPHVHCAEFSPDGKYLYASDFSADRILCFIVSDDGTSVAPLLDEDGCQITVPVVSDYGPRHLIFDKTGRHAYLIGELSGFVTVFDYKNGELKQKQIIDADPFDGRGSADIHISPDGRYLYSSNRLKGDGISVFAIDQTNGKLTKKGYTLTGKHPRHFNITPNGKYMLVACRDTNEIEIYEIDSQSGLLSFTGDKISLPKPVCIQFAP